MELSQLPQGKMGTTNKIELDRSISIKISLVVPPQWRIQGEALPPGTNSFILIQFLARILPNIRLAHSPLGNPRAATTPCKNST